MKGWEKMHEFDYSLLSSRCWDNDVVSYVAAIHEYKGKQELYLRQKPIQLQRLTENAKIQSTASSNEIEGIATSSVRLRKLMSSSAEPRTQDEEEILGYKNVLALVHENYANIPLTPNYLLQLHQELLKYTSYSFGGKFKTAANEISGIAKNGTRVTLFRPTEPFETPQAVQSLCESFNSELAKGQVDALILIPLFVLDFLCIRPFNDGNGRMSRLLTLLLLYQAGFLVGQYVSIEKAIASTKDAYYQALAASDQDWHENENDPLPFVKYLLGVILSCYRDFEARMDIAPAQEEEKDTAYDVVKRYALRQLGTFSKADALVGCPRLGSSSVEQALKRLVEEHYLKRLGSGRSTRYLRADANAAASGINYAQVKL